MSLITDTLKKMKKEDNTNREKDDEVLAPPALRNAIVNTKKYKEFVKNAELRDINGNKAPLKGFVLFSILLIAIIGITAIVFLTKEDKEMVNKAGIVAQNDVPASQSSSAVKNTTSTASASQAPQQSLGRPYGSSEPMPQSETVVAKQQENTANNMQNNAVSGSVTQNTNQGSASVMVSPLPQTKPQQETQKQAPVKEISNTPAQAGKTPAKQDNANKAVPSNIIPPNQLFAIPVMPANNKTEEKPAEIKENTAPITNTENNSKNKQNSQNSSSINNKVEPVKQADIKADTGANKAGLNTNLYAGAVAVKSNPAAKDNASTVKENIPVVKESMAESSVVDTKDSSVSLSSINEVKTIKNTDKPGTVTASTISLYNQYISTGNKAKNEGAYDRAIEYYVNALALNKTDELSANIALMYIKLKNPNMAFQVSVTNGIKDTKLLSQLAIVMIQQKYFLEANKLIQYANTFQRSADVLLATGYLNQAQNKLDDALKYYNEALTIDVTNVNAAYYAGMCYELQGKNEDAKKMYEKIVNSSNADSKMKAQAQKKLSSL